MEKQWWLVWSVILVYNLAKNEGCIEEERLALLQFKQSAESLSISSDILPSWVDNDTSDCCDWERVECNSGNTSHVTQLHLSNVFDFDINDISYEIDPNVWYLNLSLFLPFKHLATLDLSWNKIAGFLDNQGFEILSSLKELKALNLTSNRFNTSVLPSLSVLTSLETLVLRNCEIMSVFPKEIGNLTSLETLDFSYNYFTGLLPLLELGKLTRLKVLLLHNNHLEGTLQTPDFSLPPSLEQLLLSNNRFDGSLTSLCGLIRLEKMFIRNTYMGGTIPPCFNNLTSLKYLDLSFNSFTGPLQSSSLSSLTSLVYLDLTANLFNGSFSFHTFSNHSNLQFVYLSSPNTHFTLVDDPDWVPSFQLQLLVLQSCGLTRIPEFLFHQNRLRMVDLSHNLMSGSFPNWLLQNNAGLDQLILINNSLTGPLSLFSSSISSFNVSWFDASDNFFTQVAGDFGTSMFPNLKFLNLSRNQFQGDFLFSSEGECKLVGLDLSHNNFSGETPGKLVSSCVPLRTLKLSHNSFGGEIFTSGFNLTQLFSLELSDNRFIGTLPVSPIKFDWLLILDLRNNSLHGEIPSWIGNITSLGYLNLQDNFFQGTISCQLFRNGFVDLSYNCLSGPLPACFDPQISDTVSIGDQLHINLQGNRLTGSIPESFLNMSSLLTLDLRDNKLTGSIPEAGVALSRLRALLLGGNQFTGLIPQWFCQLNKINLMDLSENSFSGSIPQCFYNLSFGAEERDIFRVQYRIEAGGGSFYTGLPTGLQNAGNFFYVDIFFEEEIKFVTKHRSDAYKGDIINYMSGLDLSSNNLSGEIPREMGNLFKIRALNLSRNQLTGPIPGSLSNLGLLESLDLSHNRLRGEIPLEFISLNFLAVFSVAYNNLSGRIPGMEGQFSTFDKSSFEGNPLLCGIQLGKRCSGDPEDAPSLQPNKTDEKWYDVDSLVFFSSFSVSFLLFFVGVITVLYVNPYWRYKLHYHTEEFMFSCYYLLYDHIFRYLVRRNR